jgi:hypothetical protein
MTLFGILIKGMKCDKQDEEGNGSGGVTSQ